MTSRDSFLHDVAAGLPFGEVERDEIIEELRAHVEDSIAALESEGHRRDAAERAALNSLGPPERLARALTHARRSPRRLLAAAGAGSWAVATSAIYGWIAGGIIAGLAFILTVTVVQFAGLPFAFDSISLIAWGVAAYVSGSAVVPVVAERAGYSPAEVRRVVGILGAAVMAAFALVGWSGPLDAVGVVAILTLPAWWILGTRRQTRVRRGDTRTFAWLFVIAIAAIASIQVAQAGLLDTSRAGGESADPGELALERIAAPAPAAISELVTGQGSASIGGASGTAAGTFILDIADATALEGWRDLRVEAWRAVDPGLVSPTPVSPAASAPFTFAPTAWSPAG